MSNVDINLHSNIVLFSINMFWCFNLAMWPTNKIITFVYWQIKDSKLHFRYNLNSLRTEEKDVWLSAVTVDDGKWHTAKVSRYGSSAILELDGGEGKHYNETYRFEGHQWLMVDKQEGVYAGGKAEYTGVRTFEVYGDFQKGKYFFFNSIFDIWLSGFQRFTSMSF